MNLKGAVQATGGKDGSQIGAMHGKAP